MEVHWANMSPGEHKISFNGDVGKIEAILHIPNNTVDHSPKAVMVCCHPHPLFGGTMTNKVVHTICKTFSKMGLPAIRFNFRGIGETEGTHDEGEGEGKDLLLICDEVRQRWPDSQIWLSGFSFGSWVSAHCATAAGAQQLLSIAPPVGHFDFNKFQLPLCPWLVLMGEQDEIVDAATVFKWIEDQKNSPDLVKFPDTGHFFHGQLVKMTKVLKQHYQELIDETNAP
jgi:alpha/beta superfamily hydrolase